MGNNDGREQVLRGGPRRSAWLGGWVCGRQKGPRKMGHGGTAEGRNSMVMRRVRCIHPQHREPGGGCSLSCGAGRAAAGALLSQEESGRAFARRDGGSCLGLWLGAMCTSEGAPVGAGPLGVGAGVGWSAGTAREAVLLSSGFTCRPSSCVLPCTRSWCRETPASHRQARPAPRWRLHAAAGRTVCARVCACGTSHQAHAAGQDAGAEADTGSTSAAAALQACTPGRTAGLHPPSTGVHLHKPSPRPTVSPPPPSPSPRPPFKKIANFTRKLKYHLLHSCRAPRRKGPSARPPFPVISSTNSL